MGQLASFFWANLTPFSLKTYDAGEYSDALRDYQVRGLQREKIVCLGVC